MVIYFCRWGGNDNISPQATTHPAGNSLQDAANSLLGLINSLFGAN
jgi:hypothetical protein